jgi:hypothetical protein
MTTAALVQRLTRLDAMVSALVGTVAVPTAVELMQMAMSPPDPWQVAALQSAAPRWSVEL